MKKIIPKIILILSFAPYVFCLGYGIYSAIFGFGFLFSTSYGFDAFQSSIIIMTILLCCYPVIPICLIYQLVYLSVFIMKKYSVPKKTVLWLSSAFALSLIIIAVLIYANI
ncbi:MAG: hypothetical protein K2J47_06245 [Ruminococcus sp.]|nr:hypothetical protein [Ruminococcus sp.]MDE6788907.1 hypothetical protein [Ruminococcus sp.]